MFDHCQETAAMFPDTSHDLKTCSRMRRRYDLVGVLDKDERGVARRRRARYTGACVIRSRVYPKPFSVTVRGGQGAPTSTTTFGAVPLTSPAEWLAQCLRFAPYADAFTWNKRQNTTVYSMSGKFESFK